MGSEHGAWKGGRTVDTQGYVWVYVGPEIAQKYGLFHKNGKYVREHQLIVAQRLGRALLPGENVHHINGIRGDNRSENLELWVSMQPPGQRPEDLLAWAYEIISRYEEHHD